jgi:hypothetical protein
MKMRKKQNYLKGRDQLEYIDVDGRIILKLILNKTVYVEVWTESVVRLS